MWGNLTELSNSLNCPAQSILFPKSSNVTTYQPFSPVQPSSVVVSLRPGDSFQIPLTVTPPQSLPIDLYILMDLTKSLEPYVNGLKTTATKLRSKIVEVTPGSRIVEVTPGSKIVRSYCGGHPREQDCGGHPREQDCGGSKIVEVTPGSRIIRSYCGGREQDCIVEVTSGSRIVRSYCGGHPREQDCGGHPREQDFTTMQGLTSKFRIAFGSYVDKRLAPFSDRESLDNPCEGVTAAGVCNAVYDFHHTLNFTDNASLFMETLNASNVSANLDTPDALLDALLQIALCELAGLVNPPSLTCRLSPSGVYQDSELSDYPSAAVISQVLNEKRIIPIFAHIDTFATSYVALANRIKSAFLGKLLGNENNLPQVLSNTYTTLSSTVIPVVTGTNNERYLSISVSPQNNCAPGWLQTSTTNTCVNITVNTTVRYIATLTVAKEFCAQPSNSRTVAANIQFIGFGDLRLNISVMCQPCQSCLSTDYTSSSCSSSGALECSTCVCSPNNSYVVTIYPSLDDLEVGGVCIDNT
eukprot:Em0011g170a